MSSAAAETAPPSLAPPKLSLRDFSDRLSPMLVKELRQGLKSHVFTWGLIAMQLALVIAAIMSMEGENDRDVNSFFWWSVAGPVCVILPLRVANALRDETSANTLDTLLLTHLSAWRITLGKWLATCALQLLVAVTALPYLILRYFSGGVNMPMEIAWLGLFVLFGTVVTAVMLGLSWFPYFLVRAIIMLGVLFGAAGACGGVIDEMISRNDYGLDEFYREMSWPGIPYFLTLACYLAFYCLDLGAARLAPLSENRATRRRIVGLIVLLVCGISALLRWNITSTSGSYSHAENALVMAILLVGVMLLPAVQALSERPVNLAPVLMPFARRGLRGRIAGLFFLPGWHSGVFYALFVLGAAGALALWLAMEYGNLRASLGRYSGFAEEDLLVIGQVAAGVLGTIVMPVVVWKLTRRMHRWDFWRWILLIIAAGALHFFVTPLGLKTSARSLYANYLVPSGAFLVNLGSEAVAREEWLTTESPVNRKDLSPAEVRRLQQERSFLLDTIEQRQLRQHGIITAISCLLWLAAAVWFAAREMAATTRDMRELP